MSDTYRPRRILAVLAALLLPAATCGVAPALRDLIRRVERVEEFLHNAQLPPVLVDDGGTVVGTVLEYNDVMLYTSVNGHTVPFSSDLDHATATVLYTIPGKPDQPPVPLEATNAALSTPLRQEWERYYFESSNCTGVPWVLSYDFYRPRSSLFSRGRIGPPNQTLYAAAPDAPTEEARLYSIEYSNGFGPGGRCWPLFFHGDMVPLRPVADLGVYTAPFRIVDQRELWGW